jgi:hypothetical protein
LKGGVKGAGGRRKLHSENLHSLYSSPNAIRNDQIKDQIHRKVYCEIYREETRGK